MRISSEKPNYISCDEYFSKVMKKKTYSTIFYQSIVIETELNQ